MARSRWYEAEVTDVKDPERRGRIKVRCQTLLDRDEEVGETDAPELPDWLEPMFFAAGTPDQNGGKPYGFFFVPCVGDTVEIEVSDDAEMETENGMRWRCCVYPNSDSVPGLFKGEIGEETDPEELYPHIRGILTPGDQGLIFADFPGLNSFVTLFSLGTDSLGELNPRQFITLGLQDGFSDRVIFLADRFGNYISMEENGRIILQSSQLGHIIELTTDFVYAAHRDGGEVTIGNDFAEIKAANDEKVRIDDSGPGDTPKIMIGDGAGNPLALGDVLNDVLVNVLNPLVTHTHSPPIDPMDPSQTGPPDVTSVNAWAAELLRLLPLVGTSEIISNLAKTKK